jgi:[citrate (pro-3S)-lyase] ligase
LVEREIKRTNSFEFRDVEALLSSLGLGVPENIEYTVGLYDDEEELIATASLAGNIIQGVGVLPSRHGEGLSATIVTALLKKAVSDGKEKLFIFTKTSEASSFQGLGFHLVASVEEYASLLEWGRYGIDDFKEELQSLSSEKPEGASCVVMNCNPFTKGHLYLIEKAAEKSPWLYVILVREDRSLFPFETRMELVRRGVSDLENVTVLTGGDYVISNLTFPSYFTRDDDLTSSHATLDLTIFGKHVAPSLSVVKRFVGEEPYCPVTSTYNEHMKQILPQFGIELEVIPRLTLGDIPISASTVRQYIRESRMEELADLVPPTTYDFLISPDASEIIEKIRTSTSRH